MTIKTVLISGRIYITIIDNRGMIVFTNVPKGAKGNE